MSKAPFLQTTTIIWLLLILTTLFSWIIGGDSVQNAKISSIAVLAVAFFKVHLVGMYFMELKHAPAFLRLVFDAWSVLVGLGLIAVYLWL